MRENSARFAKSWFVLSCSVVVSALGFAACSSDPRDSASPTAGAGGLGNAPSATAGALASAGSPSGANGGAGTTGGTGAVATGGAGAAGGQPSGGANTAGSSGNPGSSGQGGAPNVGGGGASSAGAGASSGGASGAGGGAGATGGSGATSGSGAIGGSGGNFSPPFILGADISSVQESNLTFRDTDGQTKSIFELLKNHGFNYVRLKTFVDPDAPYGYASSANGCAGLREPFGDRDHVVAFGKQAKAAGMGLLIDFHYSDVWADPGNQIIPEAWRGASSITELAGFVRDYTKDVVTTAIAAGARPDMVQIGNEITPGMLMHVPGPNTDCWGNNPAPAPIGGSTSNWDNLATLLKAGIEAVREVDAGIQVMLHIENTDDLAGVRRWVDAARARDVDFDILGLSCYTAYQGQPSVWKNTFEDLAGRYPDLKFVIAEYNPERAQANRIMKALPDGRGLGTFFWEPTRSGDWGEAMFTFQGGVAVAKAQDFMEFDALLPELGLR